MVLSVGDEWWYVKEVGEVPSEHGEDNCAERGSDMKGKEKLYAPGVWER